MLDMILEIIELTDKIPINKNIKIWSIPSVNILERKKENVSFTNTFFSQVNDLNTHSLFVIYANKTPNNHANMFEII